MEIKKRILSAAILIVFLARVLECASVNSIDPENNMTDTINDSNLEIMKEYINMRYENKLLDNQIRTYDEIAKDENDSTYLDIVTEREKEADPFIVYNEALEGTDIKVNGNIIEFLSTLRDDQNKVAISSVTGHYNMVSLEGNDTYVITSEDGIPCQPRVADRVFDNEFYYDILTGIYASDGMAGIDDDTLTFGEYVDKYSLEPIGTCLPTFGKCEASEETLKTIEGIFGKEVANVIKEKGLPVPYYSFASIYSRGFGITPPATDELVKGLTN